jgi:hypothetical protein
MIESILLHDNIQFYFVQVYFAETNFDLGNEINSIETNLILLEESAFSEVHENDFFLIPSPALN